MNNNIIMEYTDNFKIRVPFNTIESISKILFYQNEKLLNEISKLKGWDFKKIQKKYLIDTQNKIEVFYEKLDISTEKDKEINSNKDLNNELCCARIGKGLNSRCSHKKKEDGLCQYHYNILKKKGNLPYNKITDKLPDPENMSSNQLTEILRKANTNGLIDMSFTSKKKNEKIKIVNQLIKNNKIVL